MSHFRDRVISTANIPQLPSGKRAAVNVPGITQLGQNAVQLTNLIVSIHTINPPTVNLATVVPTETRTATSP